MVRSAIILAAGRGSRLGGRVPKPLYRVLGVALIDRVIGQLVSAGVTELTVVVGGDDEAIETHFDRYPPAGVELRTARAPRDRANGVSLLAAREHVREDTLLVMADHLYPPALVERLCAHVLPPGAMALAVDRTIDSCFDLEDATKVEERGGFVQAIGKTLPNYNALDTGVFRIGAELVGALDALVARAGDASLTEGVSQVAERGLVHAVPIDGVPWIDVDTPAAAACAGTMVRALEMEAAPEQLTVARFAPSWVRETEPYDRGHMNLADAMHGVARLMSNESPFPPSEAVVDAVCEAAAQAHRYPPDDRELRSAIAEQLGVLAEHVVMGAGSTELIDGVVRTFVTAGDEVVIAEPTFSLYERRAQLAGGVGVRVPSAGDQFSAGAMRAAATGRTKLFVVCSPNNPSGERVAARELEALVRHGVPTLIDQAYEDPVQSCSMTQRWVRAFDNVVVLRTFSKSYGLAGLRIGMAVAHARMAALLRRVLVPWMVSGPALAAARAALAEPGLQRRRREELAAARADLVSGLKSIERLQIVSGGAGFVVVDVSACGLDSASVVAFLLERGVLVRALDAHGARTAAVRISIGEAHANAVCVDALRELLW